MHRPVPHSVPPAVQGFSMSTQMRKAPPPGGSVQAQPAGESRALSQSRVHWPLPPLGPRQSPVAQTSGVATGQMVPESSGTQAPPAGSWSP